MKEYTVNLKRIKLWIDEEIGLPFYNGSLVTFEIQAISKIKLDSKDVSVEFLLPYHASNYGCLSLRYSPNRTKTLKIKINSFNDKKIELEDRLSVITDRISLGINADYVRVMTDYIIDNGIVKMIPSGELDFYTGANSEIGSSIMSNLFAIEILLNLLLLNEYDFDEKQMEEFINRCISMSKIKYGRMKK